MYDYVWIWYQCIGLSVLNTLVVFHQLPPLCRWLSRTQRQNRHLQGDIRPNPEGNLSGQKRLGKWGNRLLAEKTVLGIPFPYHPWDWYIYPHESLICMVNVGKYSIHGCYGFRKGLSAHLQIWYHTLQDLRIGWKKHSFKPPKNWCWDNLSIFLNAKVNIFTLKNDLFGCYSLAKDTDLVGGCCLKTCHPRFTWKKLAWKAESK